MSIETTVIQMEQDFETLAKEHEIAASNEYIWARGSEDADTSNMHLENVISHRELASIYRKMAEHALDLIETYQED